MGQGGYVISEWDSVAKSDPDFQKSFKELDQKMVQKCSVEWSPKKMGFLVPGDGEFGRTTIMPELFLGNAAIGASGTQLVHWRQRFTVVGYRTLISGNRAGNTMAEDFKIAWVGLAFPNKQQHISEIRWQIGDRKYGRINIEEMHAYNKPAIIFEEGFIIDEEQGFELYGYIEGPVPRNNVHLYQRIVMLGAAYYKIVDKVLGNCGAVM